MTEAFKHSIRVGKGLIESGQIKEYSKKYIVWILAFFLLCIAVGMWCIWKGIWWLIPLLIVGVVFLLILFKTLQRTVKEKYLSHLVYVPMVMSARGL
ncbi:MAG: hypothetical protein LBP53_06370 [Candidatus Peribacteria bacterium]|nr:hypothetical protein [Candidatus Peribacteria bacterium]